MAAISLTPESCLQMSMNARTVIQLHQRVRKMFCSSHLTLLHYLNWWTRETNGPSPVSWPPLEPLFMLPVKRGRLTSCTAGILLYIFTRPRPHLSSREWFEPVERVTASCALAGRQSLIEDRCWEGERGKTETERLKMTKRTDEHHKKDFLSFL